jgi:hypothetical protein
LRAFLFLNSSVQFGIRRCRGAIMPLQWFLQWWNLAFIVPFLLALLYLLVYAASGLTFGEADADAGADADADLDADASLDADADAELDAGDIDGHDLHGAETDVHDADVHDVHAHDAHGHDAHEADHDADVFVLKALGWLGLGRVPLSIILMVLMLTWGAIGFLINYVLWPVMPVEWMVALVSLPAAAMGSTAITRGVVRLLARYMPTTETSARPRAKLVPSRGEALYAIDHTFGLASVRTRDGDLFQVSCRTYEGRQPIAKGTPVLLVDYDAQQEVFYVVEYDADLQGACAELNKKHV